MSILSARIELLESANNAKTQRERDAAVERLSGFGFCAEAAGVRLGQLLIDCDLHYADRGIDRPMCGGLFLDWLPPAPTEASRGEGK